MRSLTCTLTVPFLHLFSSSLALLALFLVFPGTTTAHVCMRQPDGLQSGKPRLLVCLLKGEASRSVTAPIAIPSLITHPMFPGMLCQRKQFTMTCDTIEDALPCEQSSLFHHLNERIGQGPTVLLHQEQDIAQAAQYGSRTLTARAQLAAIESGGTPVQPVARQPGTTITTTTTTRRRQRPRQRVPTTAATPLTVLEVGRA